MRLRAEAGFSLPEVLVAMTVLLIGLGGGLRLIDGAAATTTSSRAREQAVALAREVVETARSVRFDRLGPVGTAPLVQAADEDLRDSDAGGAGWTVRRRGVTFAVAAGACTVDDPSDGIGVHDGTFCATGSGTADAATCRTTLGSTGAIGGVPGTSLAGGDCGADRDLDGTVDGLAAGCSVGCTPTTPADSTPADYKRVVVLVRWDRGAGSRWVLQGSTVPYPGAAGAPVVTTLTAAGSASPPTITGTGTTQVALAATTDREAAAVAWEVDGVPLTGAGGSGTGWQATWPLGTVGTTEPVPGEVVDGVHTVTATATDRNGSRGQPRALTVTVNRRVPYAPRGFVAGRQPDGVLAEWLATADADLAGYTVVRQAPGGGATQTVCELTRTTSCLDPSPPAGDTRYWAVAVDRSPQGVLREGARSAQPVVRGANAVPTAPVLRSATRTGTSVALAWDASTDPDGDDIAFYRIYRDGTAVADRYGRTTGPATTWTDTSAGTRQHRYAVTAVDTQLGESPLSSVVTG